MYDGPGRYYDPAHLHVMRDDGSRPGNRRNDEEPCGESQRQRAAATYTEMFGGVTWMKASVAALSPVTLAVPRDYLQDS